jgi:hypothetical protein
VGSRRALRFGRAAAWGTLILAAIYATSGFGSTLVLADSQVELHLDPIGFLRTIEYAWNPQIFAGMHTGFNHVYQMPYSWLYALLAVLHVDAFAAQLFVMFCIYLGVAAGMYWGLSLLAPGMSRFARVCGALVFLLSIYVAVYSNGSAPVLLNYAELPILAGLLVAVLDTRITLLGGAAMSALVFFLAGGVNPPLIAMNVAVLALVFVTFFLYARNRLNVLRRAIAFAIATGLLALLLDVYWIAPFLDYMRTVWLGGVLDESPGMHNADTTLANIFRGLGQWSIFLGDDRGPYFPWANSYRSPLFATLLWCVPAIALLAPVLRRRRNYLTVALLAVVLVSIPMVSGYYDGNAGSAFLAHAYDALYRYVPGFQMFRTVYKWVGPLEFALAGLFAISVQGALVRLRAMRIETPVIALAALLPVMLYVPVIAYKANHASQPVPSWYRHASSLIGDDQRYRVGLLPGQWLEQFYWGDPSFYSANSLIERPMIYGYLGSAPNQATDQWIKRAYRAFRMGDPEARAFFQMLGVDTLVERGDFRYEGDGAFAERVVPTYAATAKRLLEGMGLRPEDSLGPLTAYHLPGALPLLFSVASADVYPGPLSAIMNSPARRAMFDGHLVLAGDLLDGDLPADSSVLSTADTAQDLALTQFARRAPCVNVAGNAPALEIPAKGRYAIFAANVAAVYPEFLASYVTIDGTKLSAVFSPARAWNRIGTLTLLPGPNAVTAVGVSPDTAMTLCAVALPDLGTIEAKGHAMLAGIAVRKPAESASEMAQIERGDMRELPPEFPRAFIGHVMPTAPPSVRYASATFVPLGGSTTSAQLPIPRAWGENANTYAWIGDGTKSWLLIRSLFRADVVWNGAAPTTATLFLRLSSIDEARAVSISGARTFLSASLPGPPVSVGDHRLGAHLGYPQRITVRMRLMPGHNVVTFRVGGRAASRTYAGISSIAPHDFAAAATDIMVDYGTSHAVALSQLRGFVHTALPEAGIYLIEPSVNPLGVNIPLPASLQSLPLPVHITGTVYKERLEDPVFLTVSHDRGGGRRATEMIPVSSNAFDFYIAGSSAAGKRHSLENVNFGMLVTPSRLSSHSAGTGRVRFFETDIVQDWAMPTHVRNIRRPSQAAPISFERRSPVHIDVTAGPSGRGFWLVFRESYHPEWRAMLNGRPLMHVPADGYMNAWFVPASPNPSVITVTFTAQRIYTAADWISALTLLLVAVLLVRPGLYGMRKIR